MDFHELYQKEFHLTDLFAMEQIWRRGAVFQTGAMPRQTDGLLYLESLCAHYTFEDGSAQEVEAGSVLYLPKGATYHTRFAPNKAGEGVGKAYLVEFSFLGEAFTTFSIASRPKVVQKTAQPGISSAFLGAVDAYNAPVCNRAQLRSLLYGLLWELSYAAHKKAVRSREFAAIAAGILYLEQTPCPTKTVSELAELCHVSEAYFRRLFTRYAGMGPAQYRNRCRMEYAKKLLVSRTCNVSEAAERLGYEDVGYFCRAFKQYTGVSPGKWE